MCVCVCSIVGEQTKTHREMTDSRIQDIAIAGSLDKWVIGEQKCQGKLQNLRSYLFK